MKFLSLILTLSLSPSAFAADTTETAMPLPQEGNWQVSDPLGAWPFIGAGFGYMDHNDSVRTEGTPTNIKVLGSYYFENRKWVGDLGLGLSTHFLSQGGSGSDTIMSTDLGLAARYRFANNWQAGPAINTLIGTDRYKSVNDNYTTFVGAQVLKEMTYKNEYLIRVGGKFQTDTDIKGENVNVAMLELAVGFIPKRRGSDLTASERRATETAVAAQGRNIPLSEDPIRLELGGFPVSQSTVTLPNAVKIEQVARVLKSQPGLVERIQIVGHADPSGSESVNSRLGLERAEEVAKIFARNGVPSSRIQTITLGANQPVESSREPASLAKSRRVEVRFLGVRDQEKLNELISQ